MKKELLLLSFVEGAVVMVAELCGARLLAPVFGSSLYVWASVLGITLGALAAGYFFGGVYSVNTDKRLHRLNNILNAAALFVIAMPLIAYYLVPRISYLPFLPGMIISSICLLFFPVFLLGATSPFFIAIQAKGGEESGKVSGTVYAVSTVGGISATFLFGFWFIPNFGLNLCLLVSGFLLLLSNFLILRRLKAVGLFIALTLGYFNFQTLLINNGAILYTEGLMGRLEVKDVKDGEGNVFRYMAMNGIIQTQMYLNSNKHHKDYLMLLDTLTKPVEKGKALVLGLGGGLAANGFARKNYEVDAVEFDPRIIDAARDFFFLNKKVNTICRDARYYLNHCLKKYDLVFFDVFKAEEQPGHILTAESLEGLKKNLNDSGRIIINWHGFVSGETGFGTTLLYNTLVNSGFNVKYSSLSQNEDFRNILFVASLNKLPELPFELKEQLTTFNKLNTDNRQLMERYNALANKRWRANYLWYYQNN